MTLPEAVERKIEEIGDSANDTIEAMGGATAMAEFAHEYYLEKVCSECGQEQAGHKTMTCALAENPLAFEFVTRAEFLAKGEK